jgi:hypothetical protein
MGDALSRPPGVEAANGRGESQARKSPAPGLIADAGLNSERPWGSGRAPA